VTGRLRAINQCEKAVISGRWLTAAEVMVMPLPKGMNTPAAGTGVLVTARAFVDGHRADEGLHDNVQILGQVTIRGEGDIDDVLRLQLDIGLAIVRSQ